VAQGGTINGAVDCLQQLIKPQTGEQAHRNGMVWSDETFYTPRVAY